jgi:two-component system, NtrC family, response regulator AtoC
MLPPVLITGETGTGKELAARALHFDGLRREGPFVEINCSSLPLHLLESELFGHERGAFTDAKERKVGLVEAAEGGTLFLDEIGEVDLAIQAKLLKLLEERSVRRVGSTRERKVDVRIVSATNQDLERMVREGRFRSDLFFRLRIITLHMPPLRERREDVLPLARHFVALHGRRYGKKSLELSADAERALLAHTWPGNVRELGNALEQAVLLTRGDTIAAHDIALCVQVQPIEAPHAAAQPQPGRPLPCRHAGHLSRARLEAAVVETNWNVARAARSLGITRDALRYRLRKHGLLGGHASPEHADEA